MPDKNDLSQMIDISTIKFDENGRAYVPLDELIDNEEELLADSSKIEAKRQLLPYAYAFYSEDDNSLNFFGYKCEVPSVNEKKAGKTVTAIWTAVEDTGSSEPGWYNYRTSIARVCTDTSFEHVQCKSYYRWFFGCANLTNLDALANWDTSSVTGMGGMFSTCASLTNLDALANCIR